MNKKQVEKLIDNEIKLRIDNNILPDYENIEDLEDYIDILSYEIQELEKEIEDIKGRIN